MDLISRLKIYMDNQGISSSLFADTCRIPRPTMSQILNGRNKKISDELISKIHLAYPDLSILWLMFGEGNMMLHSNMQISATEKSYSHNFNQTLITDNEDSKNDRMPKVDDKDFMSLNDSDENSTFYINDSNNNRLSDALNRKTNPSFSHLHNPTDHQMSNTLIDFRTNNEIDDRLETHIHPLNISERDATLRDRNNSPEKHDITRDTISQEKHIRDEASSSTTLHHDIKISTDTEKRITSIVVFYSDNSFQSFYPTNY